MRKDGTQVKCFKCGGSHYCSKLPQVGKDKKGNKERHNDTKQNWAQANYNWNWRRME